MKIAKTLALSLLLSCSIGFAQKGEKSKKELPTKTIKVVDSIKVTKIYDDLPSTVVATSLKDSVIVNLQDIELARKKDSLWLNEMYKSDLFDEMYNSIANQDFSDVEYKELSTEVLKQRLKDLNARTPFNVE